MAKVDHQLTAGEWDIMQAVWEHEPCAAPTVQESLHAHKKWTYSTVKTMMDRMAGKKLLKTERIRNLILYRSAVTRPEAQKGEITGAIRRAFNGALTPMMQFLIEGNDLTAEQLSELEATIKKEKRKRSGNSRKR